MSQNLLKTDLHFGWFLGVSHNLNQLEFLPRCLVVGLITQKFEILLDDKKVGRVLMRLVVYLLKNVPPTVTYLAEFVDLLAACSRGGQATASRKKRNNKLSFIYFWMDRKLARSHSKGGRISIVMLSLKQSLKRFLRLSLVDINTFPAAISKVICQHLM